MRERDRKNDFYLLRISKKKNEKKNLNEQEEKYLSKANQGDYNEGIFSNVLLLLHVFGFLISCACAQLFR